MKASIIEEFDFAHRGGGVDNSSVWSSAAHGFGLLVHLGGLEGRVGLIRSLVGLGVLHGKVSLVWFS